MQLAAAVMVAVLAMAAGIEDQTKVTPVQKVIELLNGLVEKGKQEMHEEQVQFATYKQFCDDTAAQKQKAIKDANDSIEILQADVEKYAAVAAEAARDVARHDADLSTWKGDLIAATKVREIENSDYIAATKDYAESIASVDEGIATLGAQNKDTKQAAASLLALKKSPIVPETSRRVIAAFLAQDPEENLAVQAPEANAYEFQGQGLVDMLTKLGGKFEHEKAEAETAEQNARRAFELLSMDMRAQIDNGDRIRAKKAEEKAQSLQAQANANGDLQDTTQTRDDDVKYLQDLTTTCEIKSSNFANRQQLRADELTALDQATGILGGGAVSGASEKHLPQLMQKTSLAQLRADTQNPNMLKVAAYLKKQATKINSRVLSAMAVHASSDPFSKVKKMIKDLVVKLMEEANDETEHKGWCDTELGTNEKTRTLKSDMVLTLQAEIDELTASIASLAGQITELTKSLAENDAALAKATGIRTDEKEKNQVTVADAQAAQVAVANALRVLQDFYAKSASATSFTQQPAIFDEPYTGNQAGGGGVIGMIEVIQSDFARLESETSAAEAEAEREYTEFKNDSNMEKATSTNELDHKEAKKQNQEQALTERKSDLAGTEKELQAAMTYFEKLKPTCLNSGGSYEDRVARRKEEVESLQEALRILNGEDIA